MQGLRARSIATLVIALATAHLARAQQSGAVYSTDSQGNVTNIFNGKNAVYMAGGPGPNAGCSGNGLVDGVYFFQVTNPSGTQLLSTDSITNRRINVVGGVFSGVPAGGHSTRNGPCGSKIIQLAPYLDSPSSGSEFKVWLTPVGQFLVGQGTFGFASNASKTDNFKVRTGGPPVTQTTIRGTVYYDFNLDGIYEPGASGEVPIPGWKIQINSGGVITETLTDMDGHYEFLRDMNGATHVLTSIAPLPGFIPAVGGRWLATTPNPVSVVANVLTVTVDFGNLFFVNTPQFARSKGYWANSGMAELQAADPAWRNLLNGYCLRTDLTSPPHTVEETLFLVSTNVDFNTAFGQLHDFLVGDPASGVLAFILGTQFTASVLNHNFGALQLPTYIDQQNDGVLVSLEAMIAHTHEMLCDPRSANTGPGGDEEWRAHITMCTDEWNGMNTDGNNTYTRSQTPPPVMY